MSIFSWICPFCNRPVTITDEDVCSNSTTLVIENAEGYRILDCKFIVCPNPECKKFSLSAELCDAFMSHSFGVQKVEAAAPLRKWQLIPQSKAQSFPDYIPKAILDDYNEACLIKDLSPKASATLSRRCLQGMIRDFWKVKGDTLKDEIEKISGKVDPLTWKAIDAVRSVGNIGAHMEKDVNLIVDIEPNEAELFIGLIENLLKDWYIARETKKSQFETIVQLGGEKNAAKKPKKNSKQS